MIWLVIFLLHGRVFFVGSEETYSATTVQVSKTSDPVKQEKKSKKATKPIGRWKTPDRLELVRPTPLICQGTTLQETDLLHVLTDHHTVGAGLLLH